ncbi:protein TRACHEARY ELEMENT DIFFERENTIATION-RELATED 7A-like [Vespula squamosa]|uniref:Protein TRACHEARY ELEMENT DIFFERENTIATION-RELATED 7A-like n=1 Tax=Vespula squamosa TaxID=30214 RepID=A0ABD2BNL3_VESSQ
MKKLIILLSLAIFCIAVQSEVLEPKTGVENVEGKEENLSVLEKVNELEESVLEESEFEEAELEESDEDESDELNRPPRPTKYPRPPRPTRRPRPPRPTRRPRPPRPTRRPPPGRPTRRPPPPPHGKPPQRPESEEKTEFEDIPVAFGLEEFDEIESEDYHGYHRRPPHRPPPSHRYPRPPHRRPPLPPLPPRRRPSLDEPVEPSSV